MARHMRHRIAQRYPTPTTTIEWEVAPQGRRGPKAKLVWTEAAIVEMSSFGAAIVCPEAWVAPVGAQVKIRWASWSGTIRIRRQAYFSRASGLILYGVEFADNPSEIGTALYEHLVTPQADGSATGTDGGAPPAWPTSPAS